MRHARWIYLVAGLHRSTVGGIFDIIARPELKQDGRFRDMGCRTQHVKDVYGFLAETLLTRDTADWLKVFEVADIPALPIHTLDSVLDDAHLQAIELFKVVDHPIEGKIRQMRNPSTWSVTPPFDTAPAPRLG